MEILREAGDVEMYLGELNSLISIGPNLGVRLEHASLADFLVDPRRSEASSQDSDIPRLQGGVFSTSK